MRREGREESGESDGAAETAEVSRLRERIAELEADLERVGAALDARNARIVELTDELETARRERDDAREWATFLDGEIREHRERVETLESRGLVARLRGLFG